jgi:hypothetical protein
MLWIRDFIKDEPFAVPEGAGVRRILMAEESKDRPGEHEQGCGWD